MSKILYRVIFKGEIVDGFLREDVENSLSVILKTDRSNISRLFDGKIYILKKDVDIDKAKKIKNRFENYGAKCHIVEYKKTSEVTKIIKNKRNDNITTDNSSVNRNEEDLLGFKNIPDIGSRISVPERIQSEVTGNGVSPGEKTSDSRGFVEESKAPVIKNAQSGEDAEYSHVEEGSYVVYKGDIENGKSLTEVKNQFSSYLGIGLNDIEILFSGKPVVLKIFREYEAAEKYKEMLKSMGIVTDILSTSKDVKVSSEEFEINNEELRNAIIAKEQAALEIRKTREEIKNVKRLRKNFRDINRERKSVMENMMNVNPFRNIKAEKIRFNQLLRRFQEALNRYNDAAGKLTMETKIALAVPNGILRGSISRVVPQFSDESGSEFSFDDLRSGKDLEKFNISNPYIRELLETVVDFNVLYDEIENVREEAYKDFSKSNIDK